MITPTCHEYLDFGSHVHALVLVVYERNQEMVQDGEFRRGPYDPYKMVGSTLSLTFPAKVDHSCDSNPPRQKPAHSVAFQYVAQGGHIGTFHFQVDLRSSRGQGGGGATSIFFWGIGLCRRRLYLLALLIHNEILYLRHKRSTPVAQCLDMQLHMGIDPRTITDIPKLCGCSCGAWLDGKWMRLPCREGGILEIEKGTRLDHLPPCGWNGKGQADY